MEDPKVRKVFFSEFYGDLTEVEKEWEWFDLPLDRETPLCIDPFQLLKTNHPIFYKCKRKISAFFELAFTLISQTSKGTKEYKRLTEDILKFPEVEEISLGFPRKKSIELPRKKNGRGVSGKKIADALINLSHSPKHFEQIEISTKGIGKDSISDITANLIKRELIQYTRHVCNEILHISDESLKWCVIKNSDFDFRNQEWIDQAFYLPTNSFYEIRQPVLLVPKAFLRETPSISSEQFLRYFKDSQDSGLIDIGEHKSNVDKKTELKVDTSKKKYLVNASDEVLISEIKNRPNIWREIVESYVENVDNNPDFYTQYDFENDPERIHLPRVIRKCIRKNPLPLAGYYNSTKIHDLLKFLILKLRIFTEDKEFEGFKFLWTAPRETAPSNFRGQRSIKFLLKKFIEEYCYEYDMHVVRHTDLGSEPVDFLVDSPKIEGRVLLLANVVDHISFEKEDIKQMLEKLDDINHLYYVIFLSDKSHFKKIKRVVKEAEAIEFDNINLHLLVINAAQQRYFKTDQIEGSYMLKEEREVCVSYSRKDGREIADKVCETLKARGINAIRDEEDLKYKGSLRKFMQRISEGRYVITIISDEYLKSKYCMEELLGIEANGNFEERVFPLVLDNTDIHNAEKIVDYVYYWENKSDELDKKIKTIRIANATGLQEDARLYQNIAFMLSKNLKKTSDFLVQSIDVYVSSDFDEVISNLEQEMSS